MARSTCILYFDSPGIKFDTDFHVFFLASDTDFHVFFLASTLNCVCL